MDHLADVIAAPAALRIIGRPNCSLIDVRADKEFSLGHLPTAKNIPILNDDHRHQVGLKYKQAGQPAAIELGYHLVTPLRETIVEQWRQNSLTSTLVYCWRGGLRSKISCQWMQAAGMNPTRIEGGYKELRRILLHALASPPPAFVLGGMTGSGKTQILTQIPWSIDLEGLANHRGSAFGADPQKPQPSQQQFENALGLAFYQAQGSVLLEDESPNIGRIAIAPKLYQHMAQAPAIIIEESATQRAHFIYRTYVCNLLPLGLSLPEIKEFFVKNLNRIQRKLGGLEHSRIMKQLSHAFSSGIEDSEAHVSWITPLLENYYDKMYSHAMSRKPREIIFKGTRGDALAFLITLNRDFRS